MTFALSTWTHSHLLQAKPFVNGTSTVFTCLMTCDFHALSITLVSCKDMKTNMSVIAEQGYPRRQVIGSPTEIYSHGEEFESLQPQLSPPQ